MWFFSVFCLMESNVDVWKGSKNTGSVIWAGLKTHWLLMPGMGAQISKAQSESSSFLDTFNFTSLSLRYSKVEQLTELQYPIITKKTWNSNLNYSFSIVRAKIHIQLHLELRNLHRHPSSLRQLTDFLYSQLSLGAVLIILEVRKKIWTVKTRW